MSEKRKQKKLFWLVAYLLATALFAACGGEPTAPESSGVQIENIEESGAELGSGLVVTDIGSYTGLYMEDGSDEVLSKILMLVVTNTADKTVQYAEITLTDGANTADFSLTTLPPGESVVLLEQNRMTYEDGKDLDRVSVQNVAYFAEEPSLHTKRLSFQALNGALNITNISDEDITGDVAVYYKNASKDMLYGGITYRVTISGGLKTGEIRQIAASHFSDSGSRIMFATIS